MKTRFLLLSFFCALFLVYSCKQDLEINSTLYSDEEYALISQYLDLPDESIDFTLYFPNYYRTSHITTDNEIATLGRVIFYDKNLSKDRSISCASCHKQELAFSDNLPLSEGIEGRSTLRNSLALGAVFSFSEYYGSISSNRIPFMWDNRFGSVSDQSESAFGDDNEMGMHMDQVVERIKEQPYYEPLFKKAYGFESMTELNVLNALDAFVNSMGSSHSKFDLEIEKEYYSVFNFMENSSKPLDGFTEEENRGKALFMNNCSSCHGSIVGPANTIAEYNGLELEAGDIGYEKISKWPNDRGKFKVPTLRNVALTAPYMHDGRFATLDEVLEHYSSGIKYAPNLGSELKEGNSAKKFNFSEEDKKAIIAFFNTLTDEEYINDPKFSDPFKK